MSNFRKRMRDSSSGKSFIILANDLDEKNLNKLETKTIANIKTLGKYLCAIKFNFHLILPLGEKNLQKINQIAHDYGLQTIADIKLNDIGNTNNITINRLWNCGFDAVITNPIMGPENLSELVKRSHKDSCGVITLVHMSHPGAKYGYDLKVLDPRTKNFLNLYNLFLKWSISFHADGIVVGATFPKLITSSRKKVGEKCDIFSPGVGTQGGDPKDALNAGSNYLIVGRTILNSKNPQIEAKKLQQITL